jgi:hypothetical protein
MFSHTGCILTPLQHPAALTVLSNFYFLVINNKIPTVEPEAQKKNEVLPTWFVKAYHLWAYLERISANTGPLFHYS